jgi:glycosyltransferase involved in cell wall biosynthesis
MKIAFIVEFPTQFEVPFYQYVASRLKAEGEKLKEPIEGYDSLPTGQAGAQPDKDEDFDSLPTGQAGAQSDKDEVGKFDFHVIYNNTDQGDYHDFELGKKVGWGFNLYEGYPYFIADKENIVNSISKILEREKYDFVILNGYKNSYNGLTKLCQQKHIPIALRIDSVLYNLSPIKKLLKRLYLPFAYRQFNHFFAVGSETQQFLNWLGIGDEKISYFSYSVDEEWFRKKAHDVTKVNAIKHRFNINSEKVLLSVAKFVPRESPWDILKAFELLNDKDLVLLLVGDGEERTALEDYAQQMSHLKIIFAGYIPYQELAYYYGMSDVFIHAAKNEPWGVSVHEAISCGCTVITSDKVGSSKDLIVETKNGFTYPYRDVKQLAKNISASLIINPSEKEETNVSILKDWGYARMWEEISSIQI